MVLQKSVYGVFETVEKEEKEIKIGAKIQQIRHEKNMTQQDLADMLFVTKQTVSRWEHGKREPDLDTLTRLAKVLEVRYEDLLD